MCAKEEKRNVLFVKIGVQLGVLILSYPSHFYDCSFPRSYADEFSQQSAFLLILVSSPHPPLYIYAEVVPSFFLPSPPRLFWGGSTLEPRTSPLRMSGSLWATTIIDLYATVLALSRAHPRSWYRVFFALITIAHRLCFPSSVRGRLRSSGQLMHTDIGVWRAAWRDGQSHLHR
ncbi:hypothetical protein H4582DRAFT_1521594 [Lactarius indigo]|nr:hypothetical protein H4582DRAFT_1521594 [Lactarius indigo]